MEDKIQYGKHWISQEDYEILQHMIDTQHGLDNLSAIYTEQGNAGKAEIVNDASDAIAEVVEMLKES